MRSDLNKKQKIFVSEYSVDRNATRAYVAAGYRSTGAAQSANRLLRNPKVAALISETLEQRMEQLEITADRVLGALAAIAFHDPRKFFNSDGSAKVVTELDDVTAMALAGFEVSELFEDSGDQRHVVYGLCKKFKLADKLRALEMLRRHLKMFTDEVEVTGKDGGPIQAHPHVDLGKLTDQELKDLEKLIRAASVDPEASESTQRAFGVSN